MTDPMSPIPQDAPLPGTPAAPDAPPPPAPKKERGCLFYGCGGCLVVVVIFLVAGLIMFQQLKNSFNQPPHAELMLTEGEEAELKEIQALLELDEEEARRNFPQEGLRLTSRQLAGLLEMQDSDLKNMVRFDLQPDLFGAEIRVPTENDREKTMVIRIALSVVQTGDRIEVRLRDARFGAFRIPGFIMRELENEDLMVEFFDDPANRQAFQDLVERIEIQQDAILIVPRRPE